MNKQDEHVLLSFGEISAMKELEDTRRAVVAELMEKYADRKIAIRKKRIAMISPPIIRSCRSAIGTPAADVATRKPCGYHTLLDISELAGFHSPASNVMPDAEYVPNSFHQKSHVSRWKSFVKVTPKWILKMGIEGLDRQQKQKKKTQTEGDKESLKDKENGDIQLLQEHDEENVVCNKNVQECTLERPEVEKELGNEKNGVAEEENGTGVCTEEWRDWSLQLTGSGSLVITGKSDNNVINRSRDVSSCHLIDARTLKLSDGTVYKLIGMPDHFTSMPYYVRIKFESGFPDDWEDVIKAWEEHTAVEGARATEGQNSTMAQTCCKETVVVGRGVCSLQPNSVTAQESNKKYNLRKLKVRLKQLSPSEIEQHCPQLKFTKTEVSSKQLSDAAVSHIEQLDTVPVTKISSSSLLSVNTDRRSSCGTSKLRVAPVNTALNAGEGNTAMNPYILHRWTPVLIAEDKLKFVGYLNSTCSADVFHTTDVVAHRLGFNCLKCHDGTFYKLQGTCTDPQNNVPSHIWKKLRKGLPSNWRLVVKTWVDLLAAVNEQHKGCELRQEAIQAVTSAASQVEHTGNTYHSAGCGELANETLQHTATVTSPDKTVQHTATVTGPGKTVQRTATVTSPDKTVRHTATVTSPGKTVQCTATVTSPDKTVRHTTTATSPDKTVRYTTTATSPDKTVRHTTTATSPDKTVWHTAAVTSPDKTVQHTATATSPDKTVQRTAAVTSLNENDVPELSTASDDNDKINEAAVKKQTCEMGSLTPLKELQSEGIIKMSSRGRIVFPPLRYWLGEKFVQRRNQPAFFSPKTGVEEVNMNQTVDSIQFPKKRKCSKSEVEKLSLFKRRCDESKSEFRVPTRKWCGRDWKANTPANKSGGALQDTTSSKKGRNNTMPQQQGSTKNICECGDSLSGATSSEAREVGRISNGRAQRFVKLVASKSMSSIESVNSTANRRKKCPPGTQKYRGPDDTAEGTSKQRDVSLSFDITESRNTSTNSFRKPGACNPLASLSAITEKEYFMSLLGMEDRTCPPRPASRDRRQNRGKEIDRSLKGQEINERSKKKALPETTPGRKADKLGTSSSQMTPVFTAREDGRTSSGRAQKFVKLVASQCVSSSESPNSTANRRKKCPPGTQKYRGPDDTAEGTSKLRDVSLSFDITESRNTSTNSFRKPGACNPLASLSAITEKEYFMSVLGMEDRTCPPRPASRDQRQNRGKVIDRFLRGREIMERSKKKTLPETSSGRKADKLGTSSSQAREDGRTSSGRAQKFVKLVASQSMSSSESPNSTANRRKKCPPGTQKYRGPDDTAEGTSKQRDVSLSFDITESRNTSTNSFRKPGAYNPLASLSAITEKEYFMSLLGMEDRTCPPRPASRDQRQNRGNEIDGVLKGQEIMESSKKKTLPKPTPGSVGDTFGTASGQITPVFTVHFDVLRDGQCSFDESSLSCT